MSSRYQNIKIVKSTDSKRLYTTTYYPYLQPRNEDLYVITVEGDRYDLLAVTYYSDKSLWWVIPTANNLSCDSLFPEPNLQLRIPADVTAVLRAYNSLNNM